MKIGIIGCGYISRTYIADIKKFYRELEIAAVADMNLSAAEKSAEEFSLPKACSVEELLSDPEIQIVINLTPPQAHTTVNRQILNAGKHLFSEKPFAPTAAEAKEVLDLAAEKGLMVGSAPDTFLSSGLQSTRFYLDAGIIGKPFFVTANMTTFGVETWHPNPTAYYQNGAGPILDMGPYYVSAMIALFGPIESISALSTKVSETRNVYTGPNAGSVIPAETPTHYSALIKMKSGVIINFNISFDIYKSNLPMFEIYGDGGTLAYPDPNFGGGTPKVYRKEQFTDPVYRSDEEAAARKKIFYDLPELFPRVKDYSRGIGVLDLAKAIEEGRLNRSNPGIILHLTEALEGLIRAAETGTVYQMKTTCERPEPITPGGLPSDI